MFLLTGEAKHIAICASQSSAKLKEDSMIFENTEYFKTKYRGYYVSKCGKVLSTHKKIPHILKGKIDKDGYTEYCLSVDDGQIYVRGHRLVLETFEPKNKKPTVNNKNGNKRDNRLVNLEWASYSSNNKHRFSTLGYKAPNEILIDIFQNGMYVETVNKSNLCKRASWRYLDSVLSNHIKYAYTVLERVRGKIVAYYNGRRVMEFSSIEECAKYYGLAKNSISTKIHHKLTKTQKFSREYTIQLKEV